MAASAIETAVRTGRLTRALIYAVLLVFVVYYLLPLFVMMVNSFKELDEIRGGNMLALPELATIAPWIKAWNQAQIGVQPTGLAPYFLNSIKMVVPAVVISTLLGRAQRLRADQVALPRRHPPLRADAVRLLHPLPDRAHSHGPRAGLPRHRWHDLGPGAGARGLWPRLHHPLLPQLLRRLPDRAGEGGADRRGQLPAESSIASFCRARAPSSWSR